MLYKSRTNTGIWKAGRANKKDEKERKKARAERSMAWKGERNVSPWARFCVNQSIKIVDVPTADIIRHVWVSRLEIRKCRLNWRDYIYEPRVNMTALKWTWHAPARCVFSNSRTQAELRVPRSTDRVPERLATCFLRFVDRPFGEYVVRGICRLCSSYGWTTNALSRSWTFLFIATPEIRMRRGIRLKFAFCEALLC